MRSPQTNQNKINMNLIQIIYFQRREKKEPHVAPETPGIGVLKLYYVNIMHLPLYMKALYGGWRLV